MSDERNDHAPMGAEQTAYAYKPSLLGAPWEFRLASGALEWQVGRRSGCLAYADITEVRLSFRPASLQSARFITEIWSNEAPKLTVASASWRSMLDLERRGPAYTAFVCELHRRMATVGTRAAFLTGTPRFIYSAGLAVFVVIALGLAALTARALQAGAWAGATLVGGFFSLFLWQVGNYFRLNRPGTYRPDRLPAHLLPRD
jgi:hypothetical protein